MATTYNTEMQNRSGMFAGLVSAVRGFEARRSVYNRTIMELNALNDRELADIGIHRSMIAQVAKEAARQTN